MKNKLTDYILDTYGVEEDHPFAAAPDNMIFRNPRNRKWFAVLLSELPKSCLGLNSSETADVLNLKCDPIMTCPLIDHQKIFRAYHMNKEHWISVLLDSPITEEELFFLVDLSYRLVDQSSQKRPVQNKASAFDKSSS